MKKVGDGGDLNFLVEEYDASKLAEYLWEMREEIKAYCGHGVETVLMNFMRDDALDQEELHNAKKYLTVGLVKEMVVGRRVGKGEYRINPREVVEGIRVMMDILRDGSERVPRSGFVRSEIDPLVGYEYMTLDWVGYDLYPALRYEGWSVEERGEKRDVTGEDVARIDRIIKMGRETQPARGTEGGYVWAGVSTKEGK